MSERNIKRAIRLARSHGFNTVAIEGGIAIEIPYTTSTGHAGTMWAECYSLEMVYTELGY